MFGLIVVHLDPDSVVQEANQLYAFAKEVMKMWKTQVSAINHLLFTFAY